MPSINQSLNVVTSPKAQPVLMNPSAGQIQVGGGSIGNIKAARPTFAQFMQQPTDMGTRVAGMAINVLGEVGVVAEQMAEVKSDSEAKLKIATGQKAVNELAFRGRDGSGGILTKRGLTFLDGYEGAKAEMQEYVAASAEGLEDHVKSKYILGMQNHLRVVEQQVNSKYLKEFEGVRQAGMTADIKSHSNNAVAMLHDDNQFSAWFMAAYEKQADANNVVSAEARAAGQVDQAAMDAVFVDVAKGAMVSRDTAKLFSERLQSFVGTVSYDTMDGVIAMINDDKKDYLDGRKVQEDLEDLEAVAANKKGIEDAVELVSTSAPADRRRLVKERGDFMLAKGKAVYDEFITVASAFSDDETNEIGQNVVTKAIQNNTNVSTIAAAMAANTSIRISDKDLRTITANSKTSNNNIVSGYLDEISGIMTETYRVTGGWDATRNAWVPVAGGDENVGQYQRFMATASRDLVNLMTSEGPSAVQKRAQEYIADLRDPSEALSTNQHVPYSTIAMPHKDGLIYELLGRTDGGEAVVPVVFNAASAKHINLRARVLHEGVPLDFGTATKLAEQYGGDAEQIYWDRIAGAELTMLTKDPRYTPGTTRYNRAVRRLFGQIDYLMRISKSPGGVFDGSTDTVQQ